MRIGVTRSGGFAGVVLHRQVEISPEQLEQLRALRGTSSSVPDAFSYEVTAGDETFTVADERALSLLEQLFRSSS